MLRGGVLGRAPAAPAAAADGGARGGGQDAAGPGARRRRGGGEPAGAGPILQVPRDAVHVLRQGAETAA